MNQLRKIIRKFPPPSDYEIAQSVKPINIAKIANSINLTDDDYHLFGKYKAKIDFKNVRQRLPENSDGNYVVVAGITPTPLGEGKSTVTLGLVQGLAHLNKLAIACIRQPSMGPTFGVKGGAAGGGYSQVIPMEDMNLHLTGDIHAMGAAHNLLAAAVDSRRFHEATQQDEALFNRLCPKNKQGKREFAPVMYKRLKNLGINKQSPDQLSPEEQRAFARLDMDPQQIVWNRVVDINDRYLRQIEIGLAPSEKGLSRKSQFDITVASEIMAILALARDLKDLKERLGSMIVAFNKKGKPIFCDDIGATGALCALLIDTLQPTLLQTLEGTPVFVHCGPFANIAHGNSSVMADDLALRIVGKEGYCITEAGFGADIGMEKFMNIKCRHSGLKPKLAVIVATVRALKMHGGGPAVSPGAPLDSSYTNENVDLLKKGVCNLQKHIENVRKFGIPALVAINKFPTDTEREYQVIKEAAKESGAYDAVVTDNFANGGDGSVELGEAVIKACQQPSEFKLLYDVDLPMEKKLDIVAKEMYGAKSVEYTETAQRQLAQIKELGYDNLPICVSKTQYSFTQDPNVKGRPEGFTLQVREFRISSGAGYVYPLIGSIMTMPGLPTRPNYYNMDVDVDTGKIIGMS